MYDLVIQNAKIIDGIGTPEYQATIGIEKGRITTISYSLDDTQIGRIIDATGLIVTPGFIDMSNHSDTHLSIFDMPSQKSLILQGITTIIGGNCGASLAPLLDSNAIYSIQKWGDIRKLNVNWQTFQELLDEFGKLELTPNIGSLVGYSTVRRGIINDEVRPLSPQERRIALGSIDTALQQGALGVSLGLAFSHMKQIDPIELEELAQLVHKHNKVLSIHLKSDGEHIIQSLKEVISLVQKTQVKVHINHLKVLGKRHWKYFEELYKQLQYCGQQDLPITFDVFPYTANNSVAYLVLPEWVALGGKAQLLQNLRDSQTRAKVIQEMQQNSTDYSRIIVSDTRMNRSVIGKNIQEIAYNQGVSIEEALIQLIIASDGQARIIIDGISREHLDKLIQLPNGIIASDGVGYDDSFLQTKAFEHPRCYGAMIQFIQDYIITGKVTWEEGIAKMTFLPAHVLRCQDRGIIQEGMKADLILIDPQNLRANATFSQPVQYSQGVRYSIIDGQVVVNEGQMEEPYGAGGVVKVMEKI